MDKIYIRGNKAVMPVKAGKAGAVVAKRVNVLVCVGPVAPVKSGKRNKAVGPITGAVTAGATAVTGGATGSVPTGSTVTCMMDKVGLKNMVNVAAACLIRGLGIINGDIKGKVFLGNNPGRINGPAKGSGGKRPNDWDTLNG